MNKSVAGLLILLFLYGCTSNKNIESISVQTEDKKGSTVHTIHSPVCSSLQSKMLQTPIVIPFEDGNAVVYEMLISKKTLRDVVSLTASVIDSKSRKKVFHYGKDQIVLMSKRNLRVASVNDNIVKSVVPEGYKDQSIIFFRLLINDNAFIPEEIEHTFNFSDTCKKTNKIARVSQHKPIIIGSPIKGKGWNALNEGSSEFSFHRRELFVNKDNTLYIPQRYAIDFSRIKRKWPYYPRLALASLFSNKLDKSYGAEVIAVADGTVVSVRNDIPEQKPIRKPLVERNRIDTMPGNHIAYALEGGQYAFYAHLQPGSIQVKLGDSVKKGQVLALLGNSGASPVPHLHFSINETKASWRGNGLPYIFEKFTSNGEVHVNKRQALNSTVNFKD